MEEVYAVRVSNYKHDRYTVRLEHGQNIPAPGEYPGIHTEHPNSPHLSLQFSIPRFGTGRLRGVAGRIWSDDKSERFRIIVEPEAFANLAREMMKADPLEAIRAFGKAMQDVQIPMPNGK
jgi:hypothetical protein